MLGQKSLNKLSNEELLKALEDDELLETISIDSEEDSIPIGSDNNLEIFDKCTEDFIKTIGIKKGKDTISLKFLYYIFKKYFYVSSKHKSIFIDSLVNRGYNITTNRKFIYLERKNLKLPARLVNLHKYSYSRNKTIRKFMKECNLHTGVDPMDISVLYALYFKLSYMRDDFIKYTYFRTLIKKLFKGKRNEEVVYLDRSLLKLNGLDLETLKKESIKIVEVNHGKKQQKTKSEVSSPT